MSPPAPSSYPCGQVLPVAPYSTFPITAAPDSFLPPPPRPTSRKGNLNLLSLPDDVLSLIFHHVMQPLKLNGQYRVVESSYKAGLQLSQTNKKLQRLFFAQLRYLELWQTSRISSQCLSSIARNVNSKLRRLILRGCNNLSPDAFVQVGRNCTQLRCVDLSYTAIDNTSFKLLLPSLSNLKELRIRGCRNLTDDVFNHIANTCSQLQVLDASDVHKLTNVGIEALTKLPLRVLAVSRCRNLDDKSLEILGSVKFLKSLTIRDLKHVTNCGVEKLCQSIGKNLITLDVLGCEKLHPDGFVECLRKHVPKIGWRVAGIPGRSLKQVVISSLAGNIFYVTGSDICNGKPAVYFLLVDSGTSDSFRVSIGSSSLDLTNFGSILASCFGEKPTQYVKETMLLQYGLDLASEGGSETEEEESEIVEEEGAGIAMEN